MMMMMMMVIMWLCLVQMVVVDQKIAFVGGIDLCPGRYDTPDHALCDADGAVFPDSDYYNPGVRASLATAADKCVRLDIERRSLSQFFLFFLLALVFAFCDFRRQRSARCCFVVVVILIEQGSRYSELGSLFIMLCACVPTRQAPSLISSVTEFTGSMLRYLDSRASSTPAASSATATSSSSAVTSASTTVPPTPPAAVNEGEVTLVDAAVR